MNEDKAVKAVTQKFIDRWKYLLGLDDWSIIIRYTKMEDGDLGECSVETPHKMATVVVDVAKHKNADHLLDTIRHELLHIFHAQFEHHRTLASKFAAPSMIEVLDEIYMIGAEDIVLKMEHLLKKLDVDVHGKVRK